ncbi:MAG: response regulator [Chitinivibrionales bacterium]|nr:response regulator [Chitinivibrionales bacterium]MBD3356759.1 response regulator [Chitinivibrionales bacterium]
MARILIVDDEGKMRALLAMALDAEGYGVEEAVSAEEALAACNRQAFDVVVTDLRMPGQSGIDLVRHVKKVNPETECIVMTAYADAKSGIEAMRGGAFEYVAKPFEMDEMLLLVKHAVEKRVLRDEVARLRADEGGRYSLDRMVAVSPAMRQVIAQARIVARHDATVLIRGKSGTGKELIARGIHAESGRREFVPVNCAALSETLLESELFGHEKGAFTGAHERKVGLFERAGNGTVFLDEIGDVSASLQVGLLRVLQEREFTRVGGTEIHKTEARVIAATNRDLESMTREGSFREDLFFRLNVFPIRLPRLSERTEDIPELVERFLLKRRHTAGVTDRAMNDLRQHPWPGNVRELENCIDRAVILANGKAITPDHLLLSPVAANIDSQGFQFILPPSGINLEATEKDFILQALRRANGNKTRAANLLGISRRALYSKMNTHGIEA